VAERARVAVLGMSTREVCGVRDHAMLLAAALEHEQVSCELNWLSLEGCENSPLSARARVRAWTRELESELQAPRFDAILLHYSVFAHSYRGIPLFVHPMMAALRRTGLPVITIMHEIAFPWGRGGLRGRAWAVGQRVVLLEVMRASAAVVVTADFRAEWLSSRRWLPAREIRVAPVFSNLPAPRTSPPPGRESSVIGLFGYARDRETTVLVLDTLELLHAAGVEVSLQLLGSPGRASAAGEQWSALAARRGLDAAVSFTGRLSAQALSDAMGECDVLLYADATGPASRKGTLAGSLASGRPLVAVDGPRRWSELVDSGATLLVARTPQAIAEGLQRLLGDAPAREALGARGSDFARERMGLERTREVVMGLLRARLRDPHGLPGAPDSQFDRAIR
jgi:glycosyltransferase involved in cell wall biosynthesis